jgi:hypothetical protein
MLYAAAARACQAMGYRSIQSYLLHWESGVSLKAAGWSFADNVTESNWGKRSKRGTGQVNTEHEPRWVRQLAAGARPWMTDGPP